MSTVIRSAIRHQTAPEPNGCRWCGFGRLYHRSIWVPVRKWHTWEPPTDAQRKARMWRRRARRHAEGYLIHIWNLRAGRRWLP